MESNTSKNQIIAGTGNIPFYRTTQEKSPAAKRAGRKNNKMNKENEYKRLSILGTDRTSYFKT